MPEQSDEKASELISFRAPRSMAIRIVDLADAEERPVSQWIRMRLRDVIEGQPEEASSEPSER